MLATRKQFPVQQLWLALFLVLPLLYFFLYGPYGFADTDQGFIQGLSWRILQGEIPYWNFIYVRPPVSPLLHAAEMAVLPEQYVVLGSRLVFYLMLWASVLWGTLALEKYFSLGKLGINKWLFAAIAFVFAVHNYPPMPWHTVDGVFFASLGIFLFSRGRAAVWAVSGMLAMVLAAGCKQPFFLMPPLGLIMLWGMYGRRPLLWGMGSLVVAVGLPLLALAWKQPLFLSVMGDQLFGVTSLGDLLDAGILEYGKWLRLWPGLLVGIWILNGGLKGEAWRRERKHPFSKWLRRERPALQGLSGDVGADEETGAQLEGVEELRGEGSYAGGVGSNAGGWDSNTEGRDSNAEGGDSNAEGRDSNAEGQETESGVKPTGWRGLFARLPREVWAVALLIAIFGAVLGWNVKEAFQQKAFVPPLGGYVQALFLLGLLSAWQVRKEFSRGAWVLHGLLLMAWASGISWGYPVPVLAFVPLLFGLLWYVRRELRWTGERFFFPIMLVAGLLTFFLLQRFPYRDGPRSEMVKADLPRMKGIFTHPAQVDKFRQLFRFAKEAKGNYTVLPAMPLAHFLTGDRPPVQVDWAHNAEMNWAGNQQLLINKLEFLQPMVLIERDKKYQGEESGKYGSQLLTYVLDEAKDCGSAELEIQMQQLRNAFEELKADMEMLDDSLRDSSARLSTKSPEDFLESKTCWRKTDQTYFFEIYRKE